MQIGALRRQLGRDAVQTVAGRGYLLVVPVAPFMPAEAPASTGPLSGPLPLPPDPLIGRDDCLLLLDSQLRQHRLVSVLGPGGIGKTRVALALARRLQADARQPPGGVLWVDLAALAAAGASAGRICRAVAGAGGLQWADAGAAQPSQHLGQVIHQASQGGAALAALARLACADFQCAADTAWSARLLPDHADLQLAFDHAYQRGDADVAADIIEALVLGANITGRTGPALQRWQATRTLAEHAAPLARAKLLGWGNLAQVAGTTRLTQSAQRLQAWQQVPDEDGRRGLWVALAMHAVVCQDIGDPGAADAALADCLALESPDWPPRLRRRCGWIALTRLAIARDDDALPARAGRLSVQAAAELLAQAAQTQLKLGCGLDSGRSLALQCAALAEQPPAGPADGPPPERDAWHEARQVAASALALLAP